MAGPLSNAAVFLVKVIFDLAILIVLLRLLLQFVRADFYHPICQFIVKATSPVIIPLRRYIPGYWGIDFASVVVLIVLEMIKLSVLQLIMHYQFPNVLGLVIWSFGDLCKQTVNIFFYAILISIIISWVSRDNFNPVINLLQKLTEPLLGPVRRRIPPVAGFDISPIPVMILLKLFIILFTEPLTRFGSVMALS